MPFRKKDISLILFTLTEPAKRNGFVLSQFEFNLGEIEGLEKEKVSLLERVRVKMSLIGSEEMVAPLLADLEKGLPLVEVNEFSYKVDSGGVASLGLQITLFYSSQQAIYKAESIKTQDLALSQKENAFLSQLEEFRKNEAVFKVIRGGRPSVSGLKGRENPFVLE